MTGELTLEHDGQYCGTERTRDATRAPRFQASPQSAEDEDPGQPPATHNTIRGYGQHFGTSDINPAPRTASALS
ncbi:hypothetical protein [Kribbella sp. NPDC006257]|uniref:hypothetical protein n=1 Tax=Kribbella sp. NPDC006257 TaxID=3156738 RepID=UPI0033B326B8